MYAFSISMLTTKSSEKYQGIKLSKKSEGNINCTMQYTSVYL